MASQLHQLLLIFPFLAERFVHAMLVSKFRYAFLMLLAVCLLTSVGKADIIKLQSTQSCNVIGLDASAAATRNGVHCDTGNTAFSLSALLNGNIAFFVGNSGTPSWNVVNDTGHAITSLTIYYSGLLASNADIDMQVGGGSPFASCQEINANNVVFSSSNCGPGDIANTGGPVFLPLQMTWSSGTVVAGGTFNIATASFAHAGQDAGCISGTGNCSPITTPEPSALVLLGSGLMGLAETVRRKRRV